MRSKTLILIFTLLIIMFFHSNAISFDDEIAHPTITEQAVNDNGCKLKSYLMNNLNFTDGVRTKIPSTSKDDILTLLRQGSTDEDAAACRRASHMHNPLNNILWKDSYMTDEPWGDATTETGCALLGSPYTKKYSNIVWATGQSIKDGPVEYRTGQEMGWDDAREYYYTALTTKTNLPPPFPPGRDTYFAKTFQALGQVMHLLQDMAVPAHTRNEEII